MYSLSKQICFSQDVTSSSLFCLFGIYYLAQITKKNYRFFKKDAWYTGYAMKYHYSWITDFKKTGEEQEIKDRAKILKENSLLSFYDTFNHICVTVLWQVRNKANHYPRDLPEYIQLNVAKTPEMYWTYVRSPVSWPLVPTELLKLITKRKTSFRRSILHTGVSSGIDFTPGKTN